MADALCGPSNPLQQFKQHTSLDRSLQQERTISRPSPAQGFRSPAPNQGFLDPEFEAFQAGLPTPDLPHVHHAYQHPGLRDIPPPTSWAVDFQRMQISPSPHLQQPYVPQANTATADWARGFREHVAQNAPRAQQHSSSSPQAFQHRARFGTMPTFHNSHVPSGFVPTQQSKGKAPVTEEFDEAAFERAFDQANADLMVDPVRVSFEQGFESLDGPLTETISQREVEEIRARVVEAKEARIGLHDTELTEPAPMEVVTENIVRTSDDEASQTKQTQDDDALAATAQELLEKIAHNKTDKFQNSQFLGLMRRLRDREVKVEGDKMVETVSTAHSKPSELRDGFTYAYGPTTSISAHEGPLKAFASPLNTSLLFQKDSFEDYEYDHWESPVR